MGSNRQQLTASCCCCRSCNPFSDLLLVFSKGSAFCLLHRHLPLYLVAFFQSLSLSLCEPLSCSFSKEVLEISDQDSLGSEDFLSPLGVWWIPVMNWNWWWWWILSSDFWCCSVCQMESPNGFYWNEEFRLDSKWLIDPKHLFVGPRIGEGAHAKVYEGKYDPFSFPVSFLSCTVFHY